jgi:hypothetical protein
MRGRGKASLLAVIGAFLLSYKTSHLKQIVLKINSGVDKGTDGVRGISWGRVGTARHFEIGSSRATPSDLR